VLKLHVQGKPRVYMCYRNKTLFRFLQQQISHITCTATPGSKSNIFYFLYFTIDKLLFSLFHCSLKNELSNGVQLLMKETPFCILSANSFFAFSNPDLPFPVMKYQVLLEDRYSEIILIFNTTLKKKSS
jgi:hypothetical protein